MVKRAEDWQGEAEEALRREILRRGEEITHLANRAEIAERRLKVALETISELAKYIKEMNELLRNQSVIEKNL